VRNLKISDKTTGETSSHLTDETASHVTKAASCQVIGYGYSHSTRPLKNSGQFAVYRFAQNDIAAYIVLAQRRNYISA